jgi:hypothetical protein
VSCVSLLFSISLLLWLLGDAWVPNNPEEFCLLSMSILGVSRRIAEFHDGSRTLRVIFCHPHCELCLNLFLSYFCCESSFWF